MVVHNNPLLHVVYSLIYCCIATSLIYIITQQSSWVQMLVCTASAHDCFCLGTIQRYCSHINTTIQTHSNRSLNNMQCKSVTSSNNISK